MINKINEIFKMSVTSWEDANEFTKRILDIYIPGFDFYLASPDGFQTTIYYHNKPIVTFIYTINFKLYWEFNECLIFNNINLTLKILTIMFDNFLKYKKLSISELNWLDNISNSYLCNSLPIIYQFNDEANKYIKYLLESKEKFMSILYLDSINRKE